MGAGHNCIGQYLESGPRRPIVSALTILEKPSSICPIGFAPRRQQHVTIELQGVDCVMGSLFVNPGQIHAGQENKSLRNFEIEECQWVLVSWLIRAGAPALGLRTGALRLRVTSIKWPLFIAEKRLFLVRLHCPQARR